MVRIIVHGCYGKMGQTVVKAAESDAELRIVAGVDAGQAARQYPFPVYKRLAEVEQPAEVVIDFSSPDAVGGLLEGAVRKKLALVIATTGHAEEERKMIRDKANLIPIFQSANMSLGVNLLSDLVQKAAAVLGGAFDIEIVEKHHNLKKDAPSGTAYALAEAINEVFLKSKSYVFGRHSRAEKRSASEIGIHAVRAGTIVGEHQVLFAGMDEVLEFTHRAYSRQIFALGALKAAGYLAGKLPGYYTMQDMITEHSAVTNLYVSEEEALVTVNRIPYQPRLITSIFKSLGEENVNIDMISQTSPVNEEVNVSFSIPHKDIERTVKRIRAFQQVMPEHWVDLVEEIGKITVEGAGMERQSGVAARVFEALADLDISIKTVSTSETKISCIIDRKDSARAVGAIKQAFGL